MKPAVMVFAEGEEWWYAVGSSAGYTGDSMGLRESDRDAIDALLESEWEWSGEDPGLEVVFLVKFTFTADGIATEECECSRAQIVDYIRGRRAEVNE